MSQVYQLLAAHSPSIKRSEEHETSSGAHTTITGSPHHYYTPSIKRSEEHEASSGAHLAAPPSGSDQDFCFTPLTGGAAGGNGHN